jgi:hypothetical protein
MRFPWSKIYRAFPELDGFPDEECERYVLQVRAQGRTGCVPGMAGILGAIAFAVVAPPGYGRLSAQAPLWFPSDFSPLVLLVGLVLAAAMPALLMRDQLLIRAIRTRIDNARCTMCKHSLLGLPLLAGETAGPAVRCPECGSVIVLSAIGLLPGDLLPRAAEAGGPSEPGSEPADRTP